ncbi:MAG: proteasome accessory factor PafA2 family protein [bacterium]
MTHASLMGIETEYALAPMPAQGSPVSRRQIVELLTRAASAELPTLPGSADAGGVWLSSGARFYVDHGFHPEFATPECSDPAECVQFVGAGDLVLERLLRRIRAQVPALASVRLFRGNVDYSGSGASWGCHESYLHRVHPRALPEQLLPHLVSRIVFSGSGGFEPSSPGIVFMLSPRASFLVNETSCDSTGNRGILHTKDETLAAPGFHRLHLICGESLQSHVAAYLKIGTTALVLAMVEAGSSPGSAVALATPLRAMHAIACDPSLTTRVDLVDGRRLTALEIQRHYLETAESAARRGLLPAWADEVLRHWRQQLERLSDSPLSAATTLDWAIKDRLYQERARSAGFARDVLPIWNEVAAGFARARLASGISPASRVDPFEHSTESLRDWRRNGERTLAARGASIDSFPAFLRLRDELFELDTKFAEVGEGGIFAALDAAGVLDHRIVPAEALARAVREPPRHGRARLRGEWVERLANSGTAASCDWQRVWKDSCSYLDLSDPFAEAATWRTIVLPRTPAPESRAAPVPLGLRIETTLGAHPELISAIAWSPTGSRILSASRDGSVRIWDPARRSCTAVHVSAGGAVRAVAWSPDGRQVVVSTADGSLRLWQPEAGLPPAWLASTADVVLCAAWSPDGRTLALGLRNGHLELRTQRESGEERVTLELHRGAVLSLAWSRDGTWLATGGDDRAIVIEAARASTGEAAIRRFATTGAPVKVLGWLQRKGAIVVSGGRSTLRVLDVEARDERVMLGCGAGDAVDLAVSHDERIVAAKVIRGGVVLYRTDSWEAMVRIDEGTDDPLPRGLAFHPRSPLLATRDGSRKGVAVWAYDPSELGSP